MKLLFILLLVLICSAKKNNKSKKGYDIEVTGDSTISISPSIATITFAIQVTADTSKSALDQANSLADKAVSALQLILKGDPDSNLSTGMFQLSVQYDYSISPPRFIGYQITNQLLVKTTKLKTVGQLIDAGIGAGLNRIDGLAYTNTESEIEEAKNKATKVAIQKALTKGKLVAQSLGGKVHKVKGFRFQDMVQYRPMGPMAVPATEGRSTQIFQSDNNVPISVVVDLLIK